MSIDKVSEEVEYYVLSMVNSNEFFVINEDDKVTKIYIPSSIVPLREDYVFIYIGKMRAHPENDFKLQPGVIEFTNPMTTKEGVVVKIYTKHSSNVEQI